MVDKFNSLARKFNPWLLALFATKLPLIIILSYQLLLSTRRGDSAFSIMAYSIWLAAGTGYLFLAALFAGKHCVFVCKTLGRRGRGRVHVTVPLLSLSIDSRVPDSHESFPSQTQN